VKCIYIDPPYNTGNDDNFPYKDNYQHATWLAMLSGRIRAVSPMLHDNAIVTVSMDSVETPNLTQMMATEAPHLNRLGEFVWKTRNTDNRVTTRFSVDHDYIHVWTKHGRPLEGRLIDRSSYKNPDNDPRGPYTTDPLTGKANASDRPNLHYVIENPDTGDKYPPDPDFGWITDEAGFQALLEDHRIHWPANPETGKPRKKRFLAEANPRAPISSLAISITQGEGNRDLASVMGRKLLNFPKPVSVIRTVIDACSSQQDVVVDFFAGSGTTAIAALDLWRDQGVAGKREVILVEMGAYFDTIIKPRVEKVVYSKDWEEGKPISREGTSYCFKIIRLETYEDALGNIAFDEPQGDLPFDDYVLRYMLGFETRKSETLLNVEKLAAPFSYQLDILEGGERKTKPVDLPETFNYLLGLKVSSRAVHVRDRKHRYLTVQGTTNPHGEGGERKVCVIWRDVTGWKAKDFKADAEFVKQEKLGTDADEVFVNADGVIPGARVLDAVFKERMFAPVVL